MLNYDGVICFGIATTCGVDDCSEWMYSISWPVSWPMVAKSGGRGVLKKAFIVQTVEVSKTLPHNIPQVVAVLLLCDVACQLFYCSRPVLHCYFVSRSGVQEPELNISFNLILAWIYVPCEINVTRYHDASWNDSHWLGINQCGIDGPILFTFGQINHNTHLRSIPCSVSKHGIGTLTIKGCTVTRWYSIARDTIEQVRACRRFTSALFTYLNSGCCTIYPIIPSSLHLLPFILHHQSLPHLFHFSLQSNYPFPTRCLSSEEEIAVEARDP